MTYAILRFQKRKAGSVLPVNATMNGRKKRIKAILILLWNAPNTIITLSSRRATPTKRRLTAWYRRRAARCGVTV